MKKVFRIALFLFIVGCNTKDAINNKVVSVADGDTFTLLQNGREVKVRLHGIDAPERSQEYGNSAKEYLGGLLQNHTVRLEEKDKDRYGRTVAIAYRDDGLNINENLLRNGFAWHYTHYDKNEAWSGLQQQARKQRKGLWAGKNPTPPWEFRQQKRTKNKKSAA